MKTYVITLSQVFPATHPKKGEPTGFEHKFIAAVSGWDDHWLKIHTIRADYELWRKRFEKIENGEACLSVRQWIGKPYASKQREIARLTREDGIGIQKLEFRRERGILFPQYVTERPIVRNTIVPVIRLAENNGLCYNDWLEWFRNYDLSKPLAIIQFTRFRY